MSENITEGGVILIAWESPATWGICAEVGIPKLRTDTKVVRLWELLHSSSHSLPPSPIFSGARQGPLLSTTMFRTLLRPFAIYAAYSPIETIVFFFVVGTLAYFNILSAIKNSAFLATPYPSGNPYASTDVLQTPITDSFAPVADALPTDSTLSGGVRPAYAVFRNEKWVQARESDWIYREEENVEGSVELQPLVFALEVSLGTVSMSSPASLFCPGIVSEGLVSTVALVLPISIY